MIGSFHRNEATFEDGALRAGDINGRISMNIQVVEVFGRGILEKLLLERGEVEVEVGEEEESDLEFEVFAIWVCLGL